MVNLQKGQKVDLTKTNPEVNLFKLGLGWNPNANVGKEFDVDVSAFMLNASNKLFSEKHFIFYNNLESPTKALIHKGDNRTGQGEGDDETLTVDFSKIEPEVTSIVFVVTIHNAQENNQNFGQISGSYIRIMKGESDEEILKYDLNEDFSIETAVAFGKLYLKDAEWKFEATGTGRNGGLQGYLTEYSA